MWYLSKYLVIMNGYVVLLLFWLQGSSKNIQIRTSLGELTFFLPFFFFSKSRFEGFGKSQKARSLRSLMLITNIETWMLENLKFVSTLTDMRECYSNLAWTRSARTSKSGTSIAVQWWTRQEPKFAYYVTISWNVEFLIRRSFDLLREFLNYNENGKWSEHSHLFLHVIETPKCFFFPYLFSYGGREELLLTFRFMSKYRT